MNLTNNRIKEIIRLLETKKTNGQSIDLIVFNMIKRYGKKRTAVIIRRVYPDFEVTK